MAPNAKPSAPRISSAQFFLKDYDGTLFPLSTNRLLVEQHSRELAEFIQKEDLAGGGSFLQQHRVFASKRGWFLRPTVKLDPVAEFYLYDLVYRNRALFRRPAIPNRKSFGFQIADGEASPILSSYSLFKAAIAYERVRHRHYIYFDVASYFNHIYHHDLVEWMEKAGAANDDVSAFGKFLREIKGGDSFDCLPQGLYPAKMIGSAFLSFIEESSRIHAAKTLRLMDDVWLFDDNPDVLIADFLTVQSLLSQRGLSLNEEKSKILLGHDLDSEVPADLDEIKIRLLQRQREELKDSGGYGDDGDEEDTELDSLGEEEMAYLISLLSSGDIQEEDAELVLTLMRDADADIGEYLPMLIRDFPGLAKRLYYFCASYEDESVVADALIELLKSGSKLTEFQMFWFAKITEDLLLKNPAAGNLLTALYEHDAATVISKAKILEIPEMRFGMPDLREEQLRSGHSDWLAWTAAVGTRKNPKAQRNHLLKYFRKSSPMNRLIGEFVEQRY